MLNEEKSLVAMCKFLLWLFTALLISFVGISGVCADTYDATQFIVEGYDNYGPSLSRVTTNYTNNSWRWTIPSMTASGSGTAMIFSSPIPILSGHTYAVTISPVPSNGSGLTLSTYNRIGVGSNINNSRTSYESNVNVDEVYSRASSNTTLQFAFKPSVNGSWITIPFATLLSGSNVTFSIDRIVIDDLGSSGLTQNEINNSLNNQTTIINNTINTGANNIINNQNQNTQDIIDSNNENTDRIIEENNKNFQTCINSLTDKITFIGGGIDSTGSFYLSPNYSSAYIDVSDYVGSKINIIRSALPLNYIRRYSYCFTSSLENSNCITYHFSDTPFSDSNITIPNNAKYLILHGYNQLKNENWFKNYVEINFVEPYCTNKLDEQNKQLNDLNSSLNDDDSSGATSEASDFFSSFTTNTFGLTSIITAPLNLIRSVLSSTCIDLQLPLPYLDNKKLTLPCMSNIYSQFFGSFFTIYQTITYGIIAYWVCVRIFNQVKDFKNPEHDEIEVMDL